MSIEDEIKKIKPNDVWTQLALHYYETMKMILHLCDEDNYGDASAKIEDYVEKRVKEAAKILEEKRNEKETTH